MVVNMTLRGRAAECLASPLSTASQQHEHATRSEKSGSAAHLPPAWLLIMHFSQLELWLQRHQQHD